DQVEVVNLRFAEVPSMTLPEPQGFWGFLQLTKDDIMHGIEQLVMVLLAIVVLMFVVRPLVRRIITPDKPMTAQQAIAAGDLQAALAAGASAEELVAGSSQTSKMIDIAQVQGQVHAQSVQKVGELAEKNPTETVAIIRTWLHETPN